MDETTVPIELYGNSLERFFALAIARRCQAGEAMPDKQHLPWADLMAVREEHPFPFVHGLTTDSGQLVPGEARRVLQVNCLIQGLNRVNYETWFRRTFNTLLLVLHGEHHPPFYEGPDYAPFPLSYSRSAVARGAP